MTRAEGVPRGTDTTIVGKNPINGLVPLFILLYECWREMIPELSSFQVRNQGMILLLYIVILEHQGGK